MLIHKIRPVKTPHKGTPESAGFDFFVPEDFIERLLGPGESVLIPSGIKMIVPKGFALVFFNKSGVATKMNLQVGACVVDEDYRGEVHLHVTNIGQGIQTVLPGQKLVQGLLLPVPNFSIAELDKEEWAENTGETIRGEGGFGSTGLF